MQNRQASTPIFTALLQHIAKKPLQFHIPGHKAGMGIDEEFREFVGSNVLSLDLVNIEPLDSLHHPTGIIKEAEELAAEAFGADRTFFSVQGTSTAIMAMIMSACRPGDKIIVPRNAHKSIISGIIFSGAEPIFLAPVMDEKLGIAHGVTTAAVDEALEKHPDAKAMLVINPTYYGIAANLKEIVRLCHERNIPVLVDEAHGAHIHFHPDLPVSAMDAGADLAATSVHKLGGSLAQTSILNLKGNRVSPERVQTVLNMLTTTSTSYILLASLDTARRRLALHGREIMERAIMYANEARNAINQIPGLYCVGKEILGTESAYDYDPTKLVIHVKELGITGHDAEVWLREHYHIEVELSDIYNIMCIVTGADSEHTISSLVSALKELSSEFYPRRKDSPPLHHVSAPEMPQLALSPRDAFYAESEPVPLEASVGRIMAETIMVYPPGIPIVMPGEVMSQINLRYIVENLKAGLPVQGPEDRTLKTVRVIKD